MNLYELTDKQLQIKKKLEGIESYSKHAPRHAKHSAPADLEGDITF